MLIKAAQLMCFLTGADMPGFGGREFPVWEVQHRPRPPQQFEQSDFNLVAGLSPVLGAPAIDPVGYSFDRTVSEGRSRFRSCSDDSRVGEFREYQCEQNSLRKRTPLVTAASMMILPTSGLATVGSP